MFKTKIALTFMLIVAVASFMSYVALSSSTVRNVSITEINSSPWFFNAAHVRVQGYIVNTMCYMFGPDYILKDSGSEIALSEKEASQSITLERYVSFIFDGENYTQIRNMRVSVMGHVRYLGSVTDAPSCHVEVENMQLQTACCDMTMNGLVQITVETDKVCYVIGEPVKFSLFQKNTGNEPMHGGIGTIDVYIYNSKDECVYGLSCDLDWPLDFKIMPMKEVELFHALPAWHQTSSEGKLVPPDAYTITLEIDGEILWLKVVILPILKFCK